MSQAEERVIIMCSGEWKIIPEIIRHARIYPYGELYLITGSHPVQDFVHEGNSSTRRRDLWCAATEFQGRVRIYFAIDIEAENLARPLDEERGIQSRTLQSALREVPNVITREATAFGLLCIRRGNQCTIINVRT